MKFSGKYVSEQMITFPWQSGSLSGYFRIRHYWEIGKVVNGHKSAAHTDSPDGGTVKTCLGGGMHCPKASSSESCELIFSIGLQRITFEIRYRLSS